MASFNLREDHNLFFSREIQILYVGDSILPVLGPIPDCQFEREYYACNNSAETSAKEEDSIHYVATTDRYGFIGINQDIKGNRFAAT